jgi:hypothetical protein
MDNLLTFCCVLVQDPSAWYLTNVKVRAHDRLKSTAGEGFYQIRSQAR